ncbi:MAG: sugar ABC transporter permease [Clostridia bacterium]|nr:sugar ABC transporter permease [Clostridia bacterium]
MHATTRRSIFTNNKKAYLFIAPFFIIYISFHLFPQLFSLYLSFTNYKIRGGTVWVGLRNYSRVFADNRFWQSIGNTALFWLMTLPVQMVVAVVIATAMSNLPSRMRGLLSGCYYLPVVTNLVATIFVFQLMYDTNYGVINYLLSKLNMAPIPWVTNPSWARVATVLLITWKGLGYYIVFTLAGLMSVDRSLYEYANIEGATSFQKIIHITLPSIAPILLYQAFTGTIAGWNIFMEPFLLFGKTGGPLNACMTASIYIYSEGFNNLKFSSAASMSLLLALITSVFATLQFRLFRQDKEKR